MYRSGVLYRHRPLTTRQATKSLYGFTYIRLVVFLQNGGLLQCSKLNPSTPILEVFCDPERDTYPDYRLKRESLNYLFSLALTGQDRQTATFKILVFIYWLAHGTSYKTVSETFGIPLSNAT